MMEESAYLFRIARREDKPAILRFCDEHWGARHPLLHRAEYFSYYYETDTAFLHFALAERNGRLAAVAGFIPASSRPEADIWVSLWVADKAARGAGLELMEALPRLTGCRTLACNNIRLETIPLYHFLGYEAGRIPHYYRLAARAQYLLARPASRPEMLPVTGGAVLRRLTSPSQLEESGFVPPSGANPYKDLAYISRRYYAFPHYEYQVHLVTASALPPALLVTRFSPALGVGALRIVDYIGDAALLPQAGAAIDALINESGAEYADFYCLGIDADILTAAGFVERRENDDVIIPNYLAPPLIENTEYYYFTSRPEGFTLFKADGDQDRPNLPL